MDEYESEIWSSREKNSLRKGFLFESDDEAFLWVDLMDSFKLLKVNSDILPEKCEVSDIDADDFKKIKTGFQLGSYKSAIENTGVNKDRIIGAAHNYFLRFDQVVPDCETKGVDMSGHEIPLEEMLKNLSGQDDGGMAKEMPIGTLDTQ